jgi:ABC-type nitrate/sulfonate/bicarbonate transport system substrate-binding protein
LCGSRLVRRSPLGEFAPPRAGWHLGRLAGLAIAFLAALPAAASAQVNKSGAGGLAPPSNGSYMVPIIRQLGLDKKHGLDFDVALYSDPSTLYSDFAAQRTSHIFGAVYSGVNLYARGLDVRLLFTVSTANHAFVTKDPAIKVAEDLKGKTVAATTSSGFYGMAALFLREHGLDPRRNINVISAAPAAVQTQLLADKADAGLLFDPALSAMLQQGFHMVDDMNAGTRAALGMKPDAPLWYLGAYAHKSWIDQDPKRALATLRMWQEAAAFYNEHPAEADAIVSEFTKVPVAALQTSRKLNLTRFVVVPAIEERENIDALMGGFKSAGFLTEVPGPGMYYDWAGAR